MGVVSVCWGAGPAGCAVEQTALIFLARGAAPGRAGDKGGRGAADILELPWRAELSRESEGAAAQAPGLGAGGSERALLPRGGHRGFVFPSPPCAPVSLTGTLLGELPTRPSLPPGSRPGATPPAEPGGQATLPPLSLCLPRHPSPLGGSRPDTPTFPRTPLPP